MYDDGESAGDRAAFRECACAPGTVQVYLLPPVAFAEVPDEAWRDILSGPEQARVERFRFERHRLEYIAAHCLLRVTLARRARLAPAQLAFLAGPHGKPHCADPRLPHFSLSHCEGLVAVALAHGFELGVDVEPIAGEAPLDVTRRYFAPSECADIEAVPPQRRNERFFASWTLKEAFIKATGKGLAQGLHTFAIGFDPLRIDFPDPLRAEPGPWNLWQSRVAGTHFLALAWRGAPADVRIEHVAPTELLAPLMGSTVTPAGTTVVSPDK